MRNILSEDLRNIFAAAREFRMTNFCDDRIDRESFIMAAMCVSKYFEELKPSRRKIIASALHFQDIKCNAKALKEVAKSTKNIKDIESVTMYDDLRDVLKEAVQMEDQIMKNERENIIDSNFVIKYVVESGILNENLVSELQQYYEKIPVKYSKLMYMEEMLKSVEKNRKSRMEEDHIEDGTRTLLWNNMKRAQNHLNYAKEEIRIAEEYLNKIAELKKEIVKTVYQECGHQLDEKDIEMFVEEAIAHKDGYHSDCHCECFMNKSMMTVYDIVLDAIERVNTFVSLDVRNAACYPTVKKENEIEARNGIISEFQKHMESKNDYIHADKCREFICAYVHALTGWTMSDNDVKRMLSQWLVDSKIKICNKSTLNSFVHYIEMRAKNFAQLPFMQERINEKKSETMVSAIDLINSLSEEERNEIIRMLENNN